MNAAPAEIYEETIKTIEGFYKQVEIGQPPDLKSFFIQTEQLLKTTQETGAPFLELSLEPFERNLYRHVVNTAILSLILGKAMKLKPEKLSLLAQASLLFDIGMMKVVGSDMANIKRHAELGTQILKALPGIALEAVQVALQHHERRDGSGYPRGLKDQEIHPMARIVGLADTFYNLASAAPLQRRLSLHECIQELLHGRSLFDEKCLRALLENVAFFPKGTWVKLTTGETGKVISENLGMPLRPVIKIYSDSDGERVYEERLVDLRKTAGVYIKQVLLEEKLNEKGIDPKWS